MFQKRLCLMFVLAASSASALAAQSSLVGFTETTPLITRQDPSTCAMLPCMPAMAPAPDPRFGGAAYDPRTRGLWVTNGLLLAKFDPRDCSVQCLPMPAPNTGLANAITGLAYNEVGDLLYMTDMSGTIRWYSTAGGCAPTLVGRCMPPLGPGETLTGCATDDRQGLVFYCTATPGTAGGTIYVALRSDPCAALCRFTIDSCGGSPFGLMRGLAFDACRSAIWATDGTRTVGAQFDRATCTAREFQCCPNTTGDPLVGLCILPAQETSAGVSCTSAPCAPCPTLNHSLGADPTIGNAAFSLDVDGAPANSRAFLLLNAGPCAPIPIGGFCGPIQVPPVGWVVLGPSATGGIGACDGAVSTPLPLPNSAALCGAVLCSQYIGLCVTPVATGTWMTNGLTWEISAS
ncbi:MAG: hypothetical protein AAF628_07755 [Planctomycetota bacterium]